VGVKRVRAQWTTASRKCPTGRCEAGGRHVLLNPLHDCGERIEAIE
jgi:hypothetical protein